MKQMLAMLQKAEIAIMIGAFIVMILASFLQVLNRNVLGWPISWAEELSRYCMVYMALLGTEIGLRDGSQFAISVLVDLFRGLTRQILDLIAKIAVVAYSLVIFATSFLLLERQWTLGQLSAGLRVPMYIPYFALALSFGIISLAQGAALINFFANLFRQRAPSAKRGAA